MLVLEKIKQPIPIPSLIGKAVTVSIDDKLPGPPGSVNVMFLSCWTVRVNTVLSTSQSNVLPVPSQVNVAISKGPTVTDWGDTVTTKGT